MKKIFPIIAVVLLSWTCKKENTNQTISGVPKEKLVRIQTDFGDITCWLWDETPLHKENFLALADTGYYNNTTFHRIINDFVIQGGDPNSKDSNPNNDGSGGPGYTIPAEFVDSLTHIHGALAAARMGDQVNPNKESSGSQFYIVDDPQGTHFLDGNYTVFGQVLEGLDVVNTIANQPKGSGDRPLTDVKMTVLVLEMSKEELQTEYGLEF